MDQWIGDVSAVNASIPAIAWGVTTAIKRVMGDQAWFRRILPLLPALLCFGLTFMPGIGLSAPLAAKVVFALAAGGVTGTAHETLKKTVLTRGITKGNGDA